MPLSILVTGACGVTSRAIVRSLRASNSFGDARIVGTDICDNLYGVAEGLCDTLYRVSRSSDPNYQESIVAICAREKIDVAIPVPELEVLFWATHAMPVPCFVPPPQFCSIAGSKSALYEVLQGTGLVPAYELIQRQSLESPKPAKLKWPCWMRDCEIGSTSGRGAFLAKDAAELHAWMVLNRNTNTFMISEYLPGRNFACHLLYYEGLLLKVGVYERLEYFMGRTAPSGVTGNISRGRLVNDSRVLNVCRSAVDRVCVRTNEKMHGLVAVDLREAESGDPMVTEINLRHVACTSAFAAAGHNLAESHVFAALRKPDKIGAFDSAYPTRNWILRDIDGPARWVADLEIPAVGQSVRRRYE